jgi:hypothetical protein
VAADDQVTFPVAGDESFGDLGGALGEQLHVLDLVGDIHSAAVPFAAGPSGPQLPWLVSEQAREQRAVDGLGACVHRCLTRVGPSQEPRDLLRGPLALQLPAHDAAQLGLGGHLRQLGAFAA